MNAYFAEQTDIDRWDDLVGNNVFQTKAFANIKAKNHWTPKYVVVDDNYLLVLERPVPVVGNFWYIPKGPSVSSAHELQPILNKLKKLAKLEKVFGIKIEPEIIKTEDNIKQLEKMGLCKSRDVQAANTIIVDINRSIDDIQASFSPKTRYNIRAAVKAGVTTKIVEPTEENCRVFYEMMHTTMASRTFMRKYEYFKRFWQEFIKNDKGFFAFAYSGDEIMAMDFVMLNGKKASRKDAASPRERSVRGASALLELEVIKILKDRGIMEYDLYGSPPSDEIKNPDHPFYGFGTFKAGFSDKVTDYVGCYDLPIKSLAYRYWSNGGERLARKLYRQKYHDMYF